jgi:hypothetical protein
VISTPLSARRGAAAAVVAAALAAVAVPAAWGQGAASTSVNPNTGPPGSQFTITLNNYRACAADSPNCIIIDFVQGSTVTRVGTADSKGAQTFTGGPLTVPPNAVAGPATVRAHSNVDDASTGFAVTSPGATTTTSSTTTSSTTTSTSTTLPATTTSGSTTTTESTVVLPTTTSVPLTTKKTSSHSDVPRYIAVVLVVLAAAATAAVDTRLRHLRGA